jgi:Type IX secretion system protein PorV
MTMERIFAALLKNTMLLSLRKVFLAVFVFAAFGSRVNAQVSSNCLNLVAGQECDDALNTITTAVPFLQISPDARAGGMGDAGVALSADPNAIHWNASKLAFAEDDARISLSYSPWLRNLVPDMDLAYLAGYRRLGNERTVLGASLRYFSLGSITFTDINGNQLNVFKPAEFALDLAMAQQFSDRFSGGITIRYINSNLTGGITAQGVETRAGQSVAADVSFFYTRDQLQMGQSGTEGTFNFGFNVSNVGAKMSYSRLGAVRDFLPINLRLGPSLKLDLDEYNSITVSFDANKLLVPTTPVYLLEADGKTLAVDENDEFIVASGQDPNRGVAAGIFGSFTDAPGNVQQEDGRVRVESGSVLREELREINLCGGFEYWYAETFALRGGYFWEHYTKGNRKYATLGFGVRYNVFSLDLAYMIANAQQSPLANTLRFTLGFNLSGANKAESSQQ